MDHALMCPYGYAWKLNGTLNELCKFNRECTLKLERFIPKQIWTKTDRQEVLNAMSDLFLLGGDYAMYLSIWLGPLVLEVLSRLEQSILREGYLGQSLLKKMAVVMSKCFNFNSDLTRFAVNFVQKYKPFTLEDTSDGHESPIIERNQISDADLCYAVCCYLPLLPEIARDQLGVPSLVRFFSSTDRLVRWYASCAWIKYHCMSSSEIDAFRNQILTPQEQRGFIIREYIQLSALPKIRVKVTLEPVDITKCDMLQIITPDDLTSNVTSMVGNLFSRLRI